MKTYIANSENYNVLEMTRNFLSDRFYKKDVNNFKWGGNWNGMNWENFSFKCKPETLVRIKEYCLENDFNVTFSEK